MSSDFNNKNNLFYSKKQFIIILFCIGIIIVLGTICLLFVTGDDNVKKDEKNEDVVLVIGDMTNIKDFIDVSTDVVWSSSDESILMVDSDGNIQAVGSGTAILEATYEDKTDKFVVTVIHPDDVVKSEKITLSKSSVSIKVGEEVTLSYKISPENVTNKNVEWLSSDSSIATINNGVVKGLKAGIVAISVKNGDMIAACSVTVTGDVVKATGISLDKSSITLSAGDTFNVNAIVFPSNTTNKNLVWSSSDANVATVSDGLIAAKWGGSAVITVKNEDSGISSSIKVTVKNYNLILSKGFLKTSGTKIVNQKNEEVVLRGFNLGVWLSRSFSLMQLKALASNESEFLKTGYSCINGVAFNQVLTNNFGAVNAKSLSDSLYQNFITENDLDLIAQSGANVVRVPFEYSLFLNEKDSNGNYTYKSAEDLAIAWKYLDWIVTECGKRGIYVILDLHVVPGRQNQGGWCDGYTFFSDVAAQNAVVDLWKNVASRYKDNQVVAGYDLINEPQAKIAVLAPIYDRIYDAIRSVDSRHIIFMEENCVFCGFTDPNVDSTSDVIGALPNPSKYGWENVVYSTHDYFYDTSSTANGGVDTSTSVSTLKNRVSVKIKKIVNKRDKYQVPYYVGEFSQLGTTSNMTKYVEAWKYSMNLYDKYNISYTPWSYKASWEPYFGLIYYGTKLGDLEKNNSYVTSGKFDFVNSKDYNMAKRIFSYNSSQSMRFNKLYYQMFLEQYAISSTGGRLADDVAIDCNNVTMKVGDTKALNYTVNVDPTTIVGGYKTYDVINKKVVWESKKTSIATVDSSSGKITAKKVGTVDITATLKPLVLNDDNKNIVAKCTITVKE